MTAVKGTNSYVSLAEANTYFDTRFNSGLWTAADANVKASALVTTTRMLDEMPWIGTVVSDTQALAFPRVCEYFDPKVGSLIYLDGSTIPDRIARATLELAYHLLNNDGLLDSSDSVSEIAIGSIKLNGLKSVSKVPSNVRNIIKPLLVNAGASTWWRAN